MTEAISLRKTFGEYLEKLGAKQKNLVVLDSDLSNSLYSLHFAKTFPERHFTIGISENAMLNLAAGMTVRGKLPFVCGETALLINKGLDAIQNSIAYPNLNIKIIGSNSGISNCEEGPTRECFNDLAILNSIPNLKILTPTDSIELKSMLDWMISDYGPTFLRLPKQSLPNLYDNNYQFQPEQPTIIKKGEKISIFSYGHLLHECLTSSSELTNRGLSSQIVNIPNLKPLNHQKILEICGLSELIVSVEDHSIIGGLGDTLSNILQEYCSAQTPMPKIIKIGLDHIPESVGHYQEALNKAGLNFKSIYEKIREGWLEN